MGEVKLTDEQRNAFEDAVRGDARIEEDYSGRGMYGESCVGFVGSDRDAAMFWLTLGQTDGDLARRLVRKMQTDSLGRSTIYYFPGFAF